MVESGYEERELDFQGKKYFINYNSESKHYFITGPDYRMGAVGHFDGTEAQTLEEAIEKAKLMLKELFPNPS
jgi:hypothetical protein